MTPAPLHDWPSPLGGVVFDSIVPTMRPMVRDLWVSALRSGKYPQGRYSLRSSDLAYCPLGVLCDLAVRLHVASWERIGSTWFTAPWTSGQDVTPNIQGWAGFTGMHSSQLVPLKFGDVVHPIWRLNDHFRLDFTTIAELIEQQY